MNKDFTEIEVVIHARENSSPICSGCGRKGPIHQTSVKPRRFEFIPLWEY
jgi:hypothetical protein